MEGLDKYNEAMVDAQARLEISMEQLRYDSDEPTAPGADTKAAPSLSNFPRPKEREAQYQDFKKAIGLKENADPSLPKLLAHLHGEMQEQKREAELTAEVKEIMRTELRDEIKADLKWELKAELKVELLAELKAEVAAALGGGKVAEGEDGLTAEARVD